MAASTARETKAFLASVRSGAEILCRLAAEPAWTAATAETLAEQAARAGRVELGVARAALCSRALAEPRLQTLSPALAAEAVLRILAALAPLRAVSLWLPEGGSRTSCAVAFGDDADGPPHRFAARAVLAGHPFATPGALVALPVRSWQRPAAAVVLEADRAERELAIELAGEAAAALTVVLERDALLGRGGERERRLVEAGERRLARVAFDIHDGPLQTVASLGLELGLLGTEPRVLDDPGLASRLADLHGRIAALEGELRELTQTLEPTTIARRPLDATLADHVGAFGARHRVTTGFTAQGDLTGLTPSQRIALARVVHEALTNARDHGGANEIHVELRAGPRGVHASVVDDGCGFDVGRTLPAAARKGRLGLVGMSERIRLLGGRLDVESGAGGTTITASLPWWRPVADASARPGVAASAHALSVAT